MIYYSFFNFFFLNNIFIKKVMRKQTKYYNYFNKNNKNKQNITRSIQLSKYKNNMEIQ
jgi:hypothetical protein